MDEKIMKNLGINISKPIPIMCGNTSAINILKKSVMHSRTKHIAIRYHFLKEKVAEGAVKLEFMPMK